MSGERSSRTINVRWSIRARVWFAMVAVVAAPLPFVWGAGAMSAHVEAGLEQEVRSALSPSELHDPAALEARATRTRTWITVLDREGNSRFSHDASARNAWERLTDPFVGPRELSLAAWERTEPALVHRPVIVQAMRVDGVHSECVIGLERTISVCSAARRDGERIFYARAFRVRAIRGLFDVRYQALKLSLFALAIGAVIASVLSRSAVRPLRELRDKVRDRAAHPERIEALNSERKDEIGDLARGFDDLLKALDARGRALESFSVDLAHEIKSPLATIQAASELLSSEHSLDQTRRDRLAEALEAATARMDAIATRFTELAKAESGFASEPRELIDLVALVQAMAVGLRKDPRWASVTIDVSTESPTLMVHGIKARLEDAIVNVLSNACSYAGNPGTVRISLKLQDSWAILHCSDDGPGIAPALLERVFDRFFTTRATERGTGIGLAMTRAVMEAHGGSVTAHSVEGQGATFVMTLPVSVVQPERN